MKIESNEISKSYINTEATWTHGKEITLDGVKLIPITVIEDIKADIDEESTKSFKYPNWERAKALEWVMDVIDKHTKELMK